jgi:hypothetical protein
MSLNWQMPENSDKSLLTYKSRYNGKEEEQMHPVLHSLIFLTLGLDKDYTDKNLSDVKRRIKWIKKVTPEYVTITFSGEANNAEVWYQDKWIPFLEYWQTATPVRFELPDKIEHWKIVIDDNWVDKYKGLSTNVSPKPFKTWFNRYNKVSLDSLERWGR